MKKIFDDEIIRTTFYWTKEYAEFLKEYAHLNRMSMSGVMRRLIDKLITKEIIIEE
jgi:hypothetical protein